MSWKWSGTDPAWPPHPKPETPLTDLYVARLVRHRVARERDHPFVTRPARRMNWAHAWAGAIVVVMLLVPVALALLHQLGLR